MDEKEIFENLLNQKGTPFVVLMCGIAGSGKTTFSQKIENIGFKRLSIDEEIWNINGRYGVDYPAEKYSQLSDEAHKRLKNKLIILMKDKQRIVVDSSFWRRSAREEYKQLIEDAGGKWMLLYMKVEPDVLRERLKIRNQQVGPNAVFPITEEILTSFIKSFEVPNGEGEIVVE